MAAVVMINMLCPSSFTSNDCKCGLNASTDPQGSQRPVRGSWNYFQLDEEGGGGCWQGWPSSQGSSDKRSPNPPEECGARCPLKSRGAKILNVVSNIVDNVKRWV